MLADSVGKPVFEINIERQEVCEVLDFYSENYYDIYEVYFSSPIMLTDSFYLAAHFNSFSQSKDDFGLAAPQIFELHHYGGSDYVPSTHYYDFPKFINRAKGGYTVHQNSAAIYGIDTIQVPDDEWFTIEGCEENHGFAMIFPILNMSCGVPENITWVPMGGGSNVLVHWEAGECNTSWEVSYGPAGTLPGEGTITETTSPSLIISGLADDARYVAYVRSRCARLSVGWSEWSDSVVIGQQGIKAVEATDVALHPNPASGAVLLTAEASLTGVEVYTAAGAPFLRLPATGSALRIDTSAWPSGTYLLVIATEQGTVTRRLTVAR